MDNSPDGMVNDADLGLSYDDTVVYEEQIPTAPEPISLANRIGSTKVYLLSESSLTRAGKRKHRPDSGEGGEVEEGVEEDEDMAEEDGTYRRNALLFRGSPIAHLPTARIFAYATHFQAPPMGLEWVDDNTCVLVYDSKSAARVAYQALQKSGAEDVDEDGLIAAKSIPMALWPPEDRINKSLGKGDGLKGAIRFRWATRDDVKKKGARKESEFYRKHGERAGKEEYGGDEGPQKRRKRGGEGDLEQRLELDDDLDAFLAETNDPSPPPKPPSKMRSDYIAVDGKSLLERTSALRAHPNDLASRLMAPLPRRRRGRNSPAIDPPSGRNDRQRAPSDRERPSRRRGRRDGESGGRSERPQKTQEELDAELESFLNDRN